MGRAARGGRLTWNLMGMMNNPHYRVKVHAATTPEGLLAMRFEHPCLAGGEAGGCAPGTPQSVCMWIRVGTDSSNHDPTSVGS